MPARRRAQPLLTAGSVLDAASGVHQEGNDCANQEYDEQNFCDTGRAGGNATKSEYGSNYRNDKKDDCIMKHKFLPDNAIT